MQIIHDGKGTHFDPHMIEAFVLLRKLPEFLLILMMIYIRKKRFYSKRLRLKLNYFILL